MRIPARFGPALLIALAFPLPARATPPAYVGGQMRYWSFRNGSDLRDALVYWVPGPFHLQLEGWDFTDPRVADQVRPEAGLHLRDPRRSVYTLQWRHEGENERLWAGTDQVLSAHAVGRAEASPILGRGRTLWVYDAGIDWYWASYDFARATVIRDPRDGGLWVVPLAVRLANERDDWIQLSIAPASRRTIGWAADVKWRGLRAGVERNSRYDFTRDDNLVVTLGLERTLSSGP